MANPFFSKKTIISAAIFFGGLLIASGVLMLVNFSATELSIASQSSEWTQNVGAGISAPACDSSSTSGTCSNGTALVTIDWSGSPHLQDLGEAFCRIIIDDSFITDVDCNPASYTWSSTPNTSHTYQVQFISAGQDLIGIEDGAFTAPNCACADTTAYNYGEAGACVYLPTPSLSFSPPSVPYGAGSTVVWSWPETGGTRYCNINTFGSEWNGFATGQDISGSYNPGGMNAFGSATATCYWYRPSTSSYLASPQANATLIVGAQTPPGDFSLSVGGGLACNSVPLSWTASSGADGYRILKGSPRVDISPYQPYTALNFIDTSVSQNTDYLYQIEAYNGGGANRSNTINVTTPYCSPTLNFSGSPATIFQGQSTTLSWSTSLATSCAASGAWSGSKPTSGSEVIIPSPPPSATYTLTCTGPGGSTGPQSVTIDVLPLALPDWREIIPR